MKSTIAGVCLIALVCSTTTFAQDKKAKEKEDRGEHLRIIGRPVLVTKSGAELKTRKGVVWRSYLGEVFTVAEVEGDWFWIREKRGWLWKKHTIPLDTAVEHFSREIEKRPSAEAHHQRGIAYAAISDFSQAIADYSKTIEMKPQYAGAYVNRGNANRQLKQLDKALSDYNAALTLDEKNFVALNNRGLVYTTNREFDKAMADFDQALKLQKEYAEAYNNRGVVWREKGDYKKAIEDYSQAIKIYPDFWQAFGNRGFARKKLGQYDSSLADYSHAALLKPFESETLNNFAWILATCPDKQFRNSRTALTDAKKACELTKNKDWNCLDTLGAAYAENEKFKEAVEAAEMALKLAPNDKQAAIRDRIELYSKKKPYREK